MEEMLIIFSLALRQKAKFAGDGLDNYHLESKYHDLANELDWVRRELLEMEGKYEHK